MEREEELSTRGRDGGLESRVVVGMRGRGRGRWWWWGLADGGDEGGEELAMRGEGRCHDGNMVLWDAVGCRQVRSLA